MVSNWQRFAVGGFRLVRGPSGVHQEFRRRRAMNVPAHTAIAAAPSSDGSVPVPPDVGGSPVAATSLAGKEWAMSLPVRSIHSCCATTAGAAFWVSAGAAWLTPCKKPEDTSHRYLAAADVSSSEIPGM